MEIKVRVSLSSTRLPAANDAFINPRAMLLLVRYSWRPMVMEGEIKDEGEGGGGGEDIRDETAEGVIEYVAQIGDYRRTQRKECYNLVRRMKLLLPLFEETRELDEPIPERGAAWLANLKMMLLMAKKLLKTCHEGSKIYLVELMIMQLRRARKRMDTQDIELAMDIKVVLPKKVDRNADSATIERLAQRLDLKKSENLKIETIAVRNLVNDKERGGPSAETTQQIIDLLNKFRQIAGMEATNVLDDPVMPKMLEKCPSLMIPHEFLCPITLEIMTDPVIVASGLTYNRESIQKWLDTNHRTCPKTRQTLAHLSLAPIYALKNLIMQWCEKNNFQLPKNETSSGQESSSTKHKEEISSLVNQLSSSHLEVQRNAAMKIRLISKENPENRILVAKSGGIPPLVQLLSYPGSKIQQHAVTALLNLSIDKTNKKLITREEAIPAIIERTSAAALFSLSMFDENKVIVGSSNGIPPLVDLLQDGTIRGKKRRCHGTWNLWGKERPNKESATSVLLELGSSNYSFLLAALQFGVYEHLVEITRSGTSRGQRKANALRQLISKSEQIPRTTN
ncbi:unnamed protein product [Malus baccata var. baccata]